jgi:hypothetical protein
MVLGFSRNVALVAFPTRLPLTVLKLERVIPVSRSKNPSTAFDDAIVNAIEEQIAITMPFTVNKITGLAVPVVSNNEVLRARVVPNPATASGPINAHPAAVQTCRVLSVVLSHSCPTDGPSGAVMDNTAAPTMAHFVPS